MKTRQDISAALTSSYAATVFSLVLVIVNIIRIFSIPLTFDEVSYPELITQPYSDIITLKNVTANNHILNSVLRKFFVELFANNQFFLRVDCLLAQIVYLLAAYYTCKFLFKDKKWLTGAFVCLNLNPFLFDFWGLSRGYGLAIAFMMASAYYLLQFLETEKIKYLGCCYALCILAVLSNFSLLYFTLGVVAVVFLTPLQQGSAAAMCRLIISALPLTLLAAAVMFYLIRGPIALLREKNQLFHGGETGLFHDTIRSVAKECMFVNEIDAKAVLAVSSVLVVTFVMAGIYWIYLAFRKRIDKHIYTGLFLWLVPAIALTAVYLQHLVNDTKYLIDRAALFLIVLYVLQLIYWLYHMHLNRVSYSKTLFYSACLLLSFNFLKNINLNSTWEWEYDKYNLLVLDRCLEQNKDKKGKITISVFWIFQPSLYYYTTTDKRYKDRIAIKYNDNPVTSDTTSDYFYLGQNEMNVFPKSYYPDTLLYAKDSVFLQGKFALLRKR